MHTGTAVIRVNVLTTSNQELNIFYKLRRFAFFVKRPFA